MRNACLDHKLARFKRNSCKGQALAEGTAFLVLLIAIVVGCLMLILNVSVVISHQQKIQVAATQSAQYIMGRRYWLGALRPDYDATKTASEARAIADGVLKALNLPPSFAFKTADTAMINGVTVTTVTITLTDLPLCNGWHMPIPIAATSASSTAQDITQGWRAVSLQGADPSNPQDQTQWRTCIIPCYDYFVGTQASNSLSSPVKSSQLMGPSLVGQMTVIRAQSGPAEILTQAQGKQPSSQIW